MRKSSSTRRSSPPIEVSSSLQSSFSSPSTITCSVLSSGRSLVTCERSTGGQISGLTIPSLSEEDTLNMKRWCDRNSISSIPENPLVKSAEKVSYTRRIPGGSEKTPAAAPSSAPGTSRRNRAPVAPTRTSEIFARRIDSDTDYSREKRDALPRIPRRSEHVISKSLLDPECKASPRTKRRLLINRMQVIQRLLGENPSDEALPPIHTDGLSSSPPVRRVVLRDSPDDLTVVSSLSSSMSEATAVADSRGIPLPTIMAGDSSPDLSEGGSTTRKSSKKSKMKSTRKKTKQMRSGKGGGEKRDGEYEVAVRSLHPDTTGSCANSTSSPDGPTSLNSPFDGEQAWKDKLKVSEYKSRQNMRSTPKSYLKSRRQSSSDRRRRKNSVSRSLCSILEDDAEYKLSPVELDREHRTLKVSASCPVTIASMAASDKQTWGDDSTVDSLATLQTDSLWQGMGKRNLRLK